MKRIGAIAFLLSPTAVLVFFLLSPTTDLIIRQPLFHFYVVTFTSFAAAVLSILLSRILGETAEARHVLTAVAFVTISIIFFSHGFATPNALIGHSHPAVAWSAWLTLLAGGALFAIAGRAGHQLNAQSLQRIVNVTAALVAVYLTVAIFAPDWLEQISAQVSPWHQQTIFALTLFLWLVAAYRFWCWWKISHSRVDAVLTFVAFWLANAAVSMHLFPLWHLSWWLYHFLLLLGFLLAMSVLILEYEQARQFSLLRYYLAIALILTVLLALIVSDLFARFSYNTLVREIENSFARLTQTVLEDFNDKLPDELPPTTIYTLAGSHFTATQIGDVFIQDTNGRIVYPDPTLTTLPFSPETAVRPGQEPIIRIVAPEDAPASYAENNNHLAVAFAPLSLPQQPATLSGLVTIVRPVPELTNAILQARGQGLFFASLAIGGLFIVLYLVVRRADTIITHRTEELTQAYSDLRRSETMRDDLVNMIVHDLRNPLTTITTSLDLLKNGSHSLGDEKQARFVWLAKGASQRMMSLIDDMLTVNKLEAGELRLNTQAVNVQELLDKHVQSFLPQAMNEQKEINLSCPPDLQVAVDATLIGRVVDNLVSNALKYTAVSTGKIELAVERGNGRLYIHVRDNGEGVPDDYKQFIFEKYAQAPNALTQTARKGAGLGLAFCRLVVRAHAGDITVHNNPEGGSDFVFYLPT